MPYYQWSPNDPGISLSCLILSKRLCGPMSPFSVCSPPVCWWSWEILVMGSDLIYPLAMKRLPGEDPIFGSFSHWTMPIFLLDFPPPCLIFADGMVGYVATSHIFGSKFLGTCCEFGVGPANQPWSTVVSQPDMALFDNILLKESNQQ